MNGPAAAAGDELAARRTRTSRMAWLLGAFVVALYVIGLFIKR